MNHAEQAHTGINRMIINTISVAPIGTNCYVLACEETGEAIVIDPGGEPQRILKLIDEEKFNVKFIINTHAHFDHVGAVRDIQSKKGVPFLLHQDDEIYLEPTIFAESLRNFGFGGIKPPRVDEYINTNTTYRFGNCQFNVLETPGHSPGGVCFLFKKEVFVGDTLFAGSIGRTDFPGGSMPLLMASIKEKLMTLPDETIVYCGHMGSTTIGKERAFNPFREYWT